METPTSRDRPQSDLTKFEAAAVAALGRVPEMFSGGLTPPDHELGADPENYSRLCDEWLAKRAAAWAVMAATALMDELGRIR
jgi:hypothetical protein